MDPLDIMAASMSPDFPGCYQTLLSATPLSEEEFRAKLIASKPAEALRQTAAENPGVGKARIALNVFAWHNAQPQMRENSTFMGVVAAVCHIYLEGALDEPVKAEQDDTSNTQQGETNNG